MILQHYRRHSKTTECEGQLVRFDQIEAYWSITTWGQQYLDGDVDPDLDVPKPSLRPSYAMRPGWWAGF